MYPRIRVLQLGGTFTDMFTVTYNACLLSLKKRLGVMVC